MTSFSMEKQSFNLYCILYLVGNECIFSAGMDIQAKAKSTGSTQEDIFIPFISISFKKLKTLVS